MIFVTKSFIALMIMVVPLAMAMASSFSIDGMDKEKIFDEHGNINVKYLDAILDSEIIEQQICPELKWESRALLKKNPNFWKELDQLLPLAIKFMGKCENGLGSDDEDVKPLFQFINDTLECMSSSRHTNKWMIVAIVFIVAFILTFVALVAMIMLRVVRK